VPDSGPAQAGSVELTAGGQGQNYLQLIPEAPRPGWGPVEIVNGFLAASASFAGNHAVARQYLVPTARNAWRPGWAITVVGTPPTLSPPVAYGHQAGLYTLVNTVTATGEKLATLTANGQYVGSQGSSYYPFQLAKVRGQWRILNPPRQLLLTQSEFKRVYAPRNLYYLAAPSPVLVPDPVYVPLQATNVDLANKLVTALLSRPQGWLARAVSTAFPHGTRLLRQVTLNDGAATIDLGGPAAGASKAALSQMTNQLVWTLAGPSYVQSAVQSVKLEINGHLRKSLSLTRIQSGRHGLSVPDAVPRGAPLYAVDASGAVQKLTGSALSAQSVPGEAGQGRVHLGTIAVSYGGRYVGGLPRSGRGVYYGALRRGARLYQWQPRGQIFTSLSWDTSGNLWVAGPKGIWKLRPGGTAVQVAGLSPGYVVSQLRVAPDGVRVAMIVHIPGASGTHLLLAALGHGARGAVTLGPTVAAGDDVSNPQRLTWYDADNLIVLSPSPTGLQLYQVPVNGSSSTTLNTIPGTQSVSAAGPANPLAAGLAGQVALTHSLNGTWMTQQGPGLSPTYPG
jgi:spore germination protein GerM